MPIRVGIDLTSVTGVQESIGTHGDRYLERVYTDAELAECRTGAGMDAERLAARFAVKEAAMKVLRPSEHDAVPWTEIEVRHADASDAVEVGFSGRAAELAAAERHRPPHRQPHARGRVRGRGRGGGDGPGRPVVDEIRQIVAEHGRLPVEVDGLAVDADLYQAGMTSHASVNVMLALEDAFDVEFPDRMLRRDVFESIAAIEAALTELQAEEAA